MAKFSTIQWCDSTVNMTMGCFGCELFATPSEVTRQIDTSVLLECGAKISSHKLLKELIDEVYQKIKNPERGHRNTVSTTNIWHLREKLTNEISRLHGKSAGHAALVAIKMSITCYAAKLHLNRGASIMNPGRGANVGYAPSFEQVSNFEGRVAQAAGWNDLLDSKKPKAPWKGKLARLIFVSDMGDALSSRSERQFAFLERELIEPVLSEKGQRHIWMWLTKRPLNLRDFAGRIGGLPVNMCAMTTVTGPETLCRVAELRQVKAACRGLSIEPLWARIRPRDLDLSGIDWVIVGGESGAGELTRPFDLEWAEELRELCHRRGVAYFLKQLGRNPIANGKSIRLSDPHGGEWSEWPDHLKIREFPAYFHQYRVGERVAGNCPRPA